MPRSGDLARVHETGMGGLQATSVIESLFTRPLAVLPDAAPFATRAPLSRHRPNGQEAGVFIVFTLRRKGDELLIRPISARYMHKKKIDAYEKANPDL